MKRRKMELHFWDNKDTSKVALNLAEDLYDRYTESLLNTFDSAYYNKCLSVKNLESFTATYHTAEYHHTLYYYDQAGSLVKTIPPAGVITNYSTEWLAAVGASRKNNETSLQPAHTLATNYRYNTLGPVIAQQTPDAGMSTFFYDRLGRLVVSQNAKQNQAANRYSYTMYDSLGRIKEVGEATGGLLTQAIAQNQESFTNWSAALTNRQQVTRTFYDEAYTPFCNPGAPDNLLCQKNLRNRVSYTYIMQTDNTSGDWDAATFYSYDIHGNVDTLLQDYKAGKMRLAQNRWKKMVYQYDLIRGKVNQVAYQPGSVDAFYHRYSYDAENRLTTAATSVDKIHWENEAAYKYYKHGPLARTVLGENQVQGLDYTYTLQGWLKGVNTTANPGTKEYGRGQDCGPNTGVDNLVVTDRASAAPDSYKARQSISFSTGFESTAQDQFEAFIDPYLVNCTNEKLADMGGDGNIGGRNALVARDAYGYSLNYFDGDYAAIGSPTPFITNGFNLNNTENKVTAMPLYNGNIASMMVNIPKLGDAQLYGYKYDQLNRLVSMDAFTGLDATTNSFSPVNTDNYKERISYDANGNIKTYLRNGTTLPATTLVATSLSGVHATIYPRTVIEHAPLAMDDLTYQYERDASGKLLSNKLRYVHDQVADAAYADDIDNQTPLSLANVQADTGRAAISDNYQYDAIGNLIQDTKEGISNIEWTVYGKISKITKLKNGMSTTIAYSYDAAGNRISKTVTPAVGNAVITWYVRDAAGNTMSVYTADTANSGHLTQTEIDLYGSSRLGVNNVSVDVEFPVEPADGIYTFIRGNKFFELNNHLGNVLATVSDKKLGHTSNGTIIDYYAADVVTANDYYPFGMQMPGRKFSNGAGAYRYGFNGKENDNEVKGDSNQQYYGMRIYDPRLGRFLSVDPLASKFPHMSPYAAMDNDLINKTDQDGQEPIKPLAGTVATFISVFNNTPSKIGLTTGAQAGQALLRLGSTEFSWKQMRPLPTTTPYFNNRNGRYIYTEKGGWIDMVHFLFYAGKGYEYKQEKEFAQKALDEISKSGGNAGMGAAGLMKTAQQDPV